MPKDCHGMGFSLPPMASRPGQLSAARPHCTACARRAPPSCAGSSRFACSCCLGPGLHTAQLPCFCRACCSLDAALSCIRCSSQVARRQLHGAQQVLQRCGKHLRHRGVSRGATNGRVRPGQRLAQLTENFQKNSALTTTGTARSAPRAGKAGWSKHCLGDPWLGAGSHRQPIESRSARRLAVVEQQLPKRAPALPPHLIDKGQRPAVVPE